MFTLKLTHGLSHDNGFVRATREQPYVEVKDEAVAKFCIDSGFFEDVTNGGPNGTAIPIKLEKREPDEKSANPDVSTETLAPADDEDELDAMTLPELKAYAETVGISLGKLTKKADIIAAIRKAEAE